MKEKVLLLILSILMTTINIPVAHAAGNVYYVDIQNGSDLNNGSIDSPFATLSRVSEVMKPGDTCYIKKGIYRETLNASLRATEEKPVTYKAYGDGEVIISSADLVDNWTVYEGDIYKVDVSWNIDGGNMVFADGIMCHEARWPNAGDSLLDTESYAKPESLTGSGTYTISNSEIPDIDYTGAMIWFNTTTAYWSRIAKVTEGAKGRLTFNAVAEVNSAPGSDSLFYVTRAMGLLDSEYEWYKDEKTNTLYFMAPGGVDPNTLEVEVKRREYAIDLTNSSFVNIEGIEVRGAGVKTNSNTTNCTLDGLVFDGIAYNLKTNKMTCDANGVKIAGTYNIIKKCEVKNNYGGGISISGSNNSVINCYIHDINYEHTYAHGIELSGENHAVRGNTIHTIGRTAIGGEFTGCDISYNEIYDAMKLSKDGGAMYFANNDYKGAQIHHNYIHDVQGVLGDVQAGIYCDNYASGLIFYNNMVSDINSKTDTSASAVFTNEHTSYNLFFNNTFDGVVRAAKNNSQEGITFVNNVFSETPVNIENGERGALLSNNSIGAITSAGIEIPGISDGSYVGAGNDWIAGVDANVAVEYEKNHDIPGLNMLSNNQFEDDFEGWTKESGTPKIVKQNNWTFNSIITKNGNKAATLSTGDSISKKIGGLKPNTTYIVNTFSQTKGYYYAAADVSEKSQGLSTSNSNYSGIITNITNDSWIKIPDVDFQNGEFDKMEFLIRLFMAGDNFQVRVDGVQGTVISDFTLLKNPIATYYWLAREANLESISGVHDVYIVFNSVTNPEAIFGGLVLRDEAPLDKAKLTVLSDANEYSEIEIGTENTSFLPTNFLPSAWQDTPISTKIKTGNKGEIEIIYEKNAGNNALYLDCLSISESFDENPISSDIKISNVRVTDMSQKEISEFDTEEANIVSFSALNKSESDKEMKVTSYSKDGTMFSSTIALCKPGNNKLALGVRVPNEYGQYIEFEADGNVQRITLVDIGNQLRDDTDIHIKKLWVNSDNSIQNGVKNTLSMLIRNDGGKKNVKLIIVFYDENNKLTNTAIMQDVALNELSSNHIDSLEVVPAENAALGKVFIWEQDTIRPLTAVFKMD